MKKYVNGQYIELTQEELSALDAESARAEAQERTRPLTTEEVSRLIIRQQGPGVKFCVSDIRQKSRMALGSWADSGMNPLITESHGGQSGMRAGTA